MPRKPVTEYIGGKGPRQHIWEAIRALAARAGDVDAPFTEQLILMALPREARKFVGISAVRDYRQCLVNAGIVALVTPSLNSRTPATYRLAHDEGLEAPRLRRNGERVTQGLAQEQMWRTLRLLAADTNARELAAHASTESVPVADLVAAGDRGGGR